MIIGLCDRWHKTPPEIMALDTSTLRLLAMVAEGSPTDG